jgi:hypothetical protein
VLGAKVNKKAQTKVLQFEQGKKLLPMNRKQRFNHSTDFNSTMTLCSTTSSALYPSFKFFPLRASASLCARPRCPPESCRKERGHGKKGEQVEIGRLNTELRTTNGER